MRLMVSLFILLLAFSFVLLLAQLFLARFAYMKALLAAGCALILCMSFADIDRAVLRYNMRAFETGRLETLDAEAFRALGDAKIPYLIELSYSEDEDIKKEALDQLSVWSRRMYDENRRYGARFNYNYTRRRAMRAMLEFLRREDCPLEGYEYKSPFQEAIERAIGGVVEGMVEGISEFAAERVSERASEIASAASGWKPRWRR